MIWGATWTWWVGFHAVVAVALLADSLLPGHRRESKHAQAFVWLATVGLALAAAGFACWIAMRMGKQTALEFVAGYTIETSLSIDNLFVFLVLFEGFRISAQRQHTALQWGVWGAFVLRAVFIAVGVTLLQKFEWVTWVFGLILLYAAWRLVREGSPRAAIPEWIVRLQPAKGSLLAGDCGSRGDRSAVRHGLHSGGAVGYAQSVCGVHVERCGDSGIALALLWPGRDAGPLQVSALRAGRDFGIRGAEDAGGEVGGCSVDAFAGGDWSDSGGVRAGVDNYRDRRCTAGGE